MLSVCIKSQILKSQPKTRVIAKARRTFPRNTNIGHKKYLQKLSLCLFVHGPAPIPLRPVNMGPSSFKTFISLQWSSPLHGATFYVGLSVTESQTIEFKLF